MDDANLPLNVFENLGILGLADTADFYFGQSRPHFSEAGFRPLKWLDIQDDPPVQFIWNIWDLMR